jgi:hypothetical protein
MSLENARMESLADKIEKQAEVFKENEVKKEVKKVDVIKNKKAK